VSLQPNIFYTLHINAVSCSNLLFNYICAVFACRALPAPVPGPPAFAGHSTSFDVRI
jgi:hypothetical protein